MPRKIFIDCGCHKGQSIILAKEKFGSNIEIYGFEAVPYLAYALQRYYANHNNIRISHSAVWINDTGIKLNLPNQGASWSNSVYDRWDGDSTVQHVPSIDLSDWIKNNFDKNDYIILKLDIEGAEYEVLNKMILDGTIEYVNEFHGEWHYGTSSKIDSVIVKRVTDYFLDKTFNVWEAPWYNEDTTPGMTKFPKDLSDQRWAKVNPFQKITFVLPSRNNLEFLKLAYKSIRDLRTKHEILILDDASVDGTKEWIKSLNDEDLITYFNPGTERIGIVGMFDKGIEMSRTEIIFAFHADMVAAPHLDTNILKYLIPGTVVCATRIEPPLHPSGPEKITLGWGDEVEDYNYDLSVQRFLELEAIHKDKTTEGIFAPWCMYKKDYLAIGGHDELFAPQSKEDSDLFNRFILNEYKVIQSWDGLVYHFTSRGSRFNKYSGGGAGKDSPEWQYTTNKNARNFIRKWGHFVKHDSLMKPIIPHKYNVSAIIHNCKDSLLELLEPWFTNVYVSNSFILNRDEYLRKEQVNTSYDLSKRVHEFNPESFSMDNIDILIEFDANQFNQQSFNIIQNLSDIITDSGELGLFKLDIFDINITNLQTYEKDLIICQK